MNIRKPTIVILTLTVFVGISAPAKADTANNIAIGNGIATQQRAAFTMLGTSVKQCAVVDLTKKGVGNVAIGLGALNKAYGLNSHYVGEDLSYVYAIGRCAGASLENASRAFLIGDYTAAPSGSDGFVNIANRLCFWRDTGETVDCPPPEPECLDH